MRSYDLRAPPPPNIVLTCPADTASYTKRIEQRE